MKTHLTVLIVILVAITNSVFASPSNSKTAKSLVKPVERTDYSIDFMNAKDHPPMAPFLILTFYGLPTAARAELVGWTSEIASKLEKAGGIGTKDDYEKKIEPLLGNYIKKFQSTGARTIKIEFPRIKVWTDLILNP